MEQNSGTIFDPKGFLKWRELILLILIFPPVGVFFAWKNFNYFSKKFHLLLVYYSGLYLIFSIILLIWFLPAMKGDFKNLGIEWSYYMTAIPYFLILISVNQILFAFLMNRKQSTNQILPKGYRVFAIILLFVSSLVIPLLIMVTLNSFSQPMYDLLDSIK